MLPCKQLVSVCALLLVYLIGPALPSALSAKRQSADP